ncbi:universal stress protein UspB [Citrobacter koseri]|nr:universal stress protein UspB [Citrobacter koseri]
MISTVALFWALCVVCIVNMARYFSSLRALLVVLRGCDPLLYQYVDGGGFFTSHGQPNKQMRLVWYIYAQRYRDHHDDEFIRRCERVSRPVHPHQRIMRSGADQYGCAVDLALEQKKAGQFPDPLNTVDSAFLCLMARRFKAYVLRFCRPDKASPPSGTVTLR